MERPNQRPSSSSDSHVPRSRGRLEVPVVVNPHDRRFVVLDPAFLERLSKRGPVVGGSQLVAVDEMYLLPGGWAFRKWRDKRRARASYPSEATPASPSS